MLYSIIFFFTISVYSMDMTPGLRDCMTNVLLTRNNHTYSSIQAKRIGKGEASLNKEFRQLMAKAEPGDYTKHTQATTIEDAIKKSSEKIKGETHAQYIPAIAKNRGNIEKHALVSMKGFYKPFTNGGKKGTIYKYVKFDYDIGYDGGKPAQCMRVEYSSGKVHGHPINLTTLAAQCKECL